MPVGHEREFTGWRDENGSPIYVGDRLRSAHGYDVIVHWDDEELSLPYGRLVCDPSHACATAHYDLNGGRGHVKVVAPPTPTMFEVVEWVTETEAQS